MKKIMFIDNEVTLKEDQVKVTDIAKDFSILDKDFKEVKLSDYKGKKIILSVFPSIDTGVCALSTKKFNEEASKLKDTVILTISVDLPPALSRFCSAEGIDNIIVGSDHYDIDFGKKYGFLIDELRLLARGVVVIDRDLSVKHVEILEQITEHPDYDKAIQAVCDLD